MIRPYKFLVVPVLQHVDDDGNVTGEHASDQPDIVFGVDGLVKYAEGFEEALEDMVNASLNGGG